MTDATEGRLLLVEDDEVIRNTTRMALERYGYTVHTAADGWTGLDAFHQFEPDLLILDVMLPGLDGVGLARRVRVETTDIPILMMSARSDPIDIVSGLEAGADDYVTKPFDSAVLVARIRALLRRSARPAPAEQPEDTVRRFGDVTLDTASMQVCRNGEPVPLTPTELRLLLEFSAQPGVLLDRETLLQRVWDYSWDGDTRVVDIHIQRLRAKIGADAIDTVRGFGYRLKK